MPDPAFGLHGATKLTDRLVSAVPSLLKVLLSETPNCMLPSASIALPISGRGTPTPALPCWTTPHADVDCPLVSAYQASS